jgi:hypothetical protein
VYCADGPSGNRPVILELLGLVDAFFIVYEDYFVVYI